MDHWLFFLPPIGITTFRSSCENVNAGKVRHLQQNRQYNRRITALFYTLLPMFYFKIYLWYYKCPRKRSISHSNINNNI